MIRTKADLIFYLEKDREALKRPARKRFAGSFKDIVKRILDPDLIWRFERVLRYTEYYSNNFGGINRFLYWWWNYKFKRLSLKLGFSIPLNVFGPGLSIAHYGTIVVNQKARVGNNCRLHACVNIGVRKGKAPQIGDNCYIGPGVIMYGDITIANDITIGANSVVNHSFEKEKVVIAGSPARIIRENVMPWVEWFLPTLGEKQEMSHNEKDSL